MPRPVSVRFLAASAAQATSESYIMLVSIEHELLDDPVLLSTDYGDRLSTDPLVYGTLSAALNDEGDTTQQQFLFVIMGAILPDDKPGAPNRTSLVFDNVDADVASQFQAILTPLSVRLVVVSAETPDFVEADWVLQGIDSTVEEGTVTLELSGDDLATQPLPWMFMTAQRTGALHP